MQKVAFLVILSVIIAAVGCGNTETERSAFGRAPDFELQDINGNTVRLSDYSGKVILLNFFATWCPPCRVEMPDFNEIADNYKGRVKIIAVNVGRESLSKVQRFAASNNLKFTIAMDNGSVSNSYGPIRAIPVTVLIDRNFNIAKKYIGMRTKDIFTEGIKELL
ncbi:MAG: TlpA family protein disulfide reductase [Candidatus Omnitrophica bacterium]|nr:TlpA family protein disulfide reductase [Candidatus Omnitrophota bacterium]